MNMYLPGLARGGGAVEDVFVLEMGLEERALGTCRG